MYATTTNIKGVVALAMGIRRVNDAARGEFHQRGLNIRGSFIS